MRVGTVLTLVAAGATPVAVMEYGEYLPIVGEDLKPILSGERNVTDVAEEVADREFRAGLTLEIVGIEHRGTRVGTFGEIIKADRGHVFHYVRVRAVNDGKVDIAVSNWHFSAIDEAGSDHMVELGNAHEDFDGSRLRKGAAREGTLIFELRKGSTLAALVWEGDLGGSRVDYPGPPG